MISILSHYESEEEKDERTDQISQLNLDLKSVNLTEQATISEQRIISGKKSIKIRRQSRARVERAMQVYQNRSLSKISNEIQQQGSNVPVSQ